MNKKIIIITAAAGLLSFAGAFVFAWLTKPTPEPQSSETGQPISTEAVSISQGIEPVMSRTGPGMGSIPGAVEEEQTRSVAGKTMTEKQLKALIYEVREKIREYNDKLKDLKQYEQRLQVTRDTLNKDAEELNNLRIELTSIITRLKDERDKLLKSRVEIAKVEKANLMTIAAAYDKMDAASASKILTNMSQAQSGKPGGGNLDDAVKILHYMRERSKAKLLAGLAASEPELAAYFCQKLKQVTEED